MMTIEDWTFAGELETIAAQSWRDEAGPRFIAVLVHGYGEHIRRYEHVAEALVDMGAVVYGLDHLGHGRSGGERVLITDFMPLVVDVNSLIDQARQVYPSLPVVMIGHSMGGMIAARYAQVHGDRLTALVLSGPAIGDFELLGQLLSLPEIPDIPLDPEVLSRDPAVGAAYAADELVWHGPFKRPTVEAMAHMIEQINLDGSIGDLPLLWIHGADDALVPMIGSKAGIERLGGPDTTERIYPGARHEVFNETNNVEVIADVGDFINRVLNDRSVSDTERAG